MGSGKKGGGQEWGKESMKIKERRINILPTSSRFVVPETVGRGFCSLIQRNPVFKRCPVKRSSEGRLNESSDGS